MKAIQLKQHWQVVFIIILFMVVMLLVSMWFNNRIEMIESDISPFSGNG